MKIRNIGLTLVMVIFSLYSFSSAYTEDFEKVPGDTELTSSLAEELKGKGKQIAIRFNANITLTSFDSKIYFYEGKLITEEEAVALESQETANYQLLSFFVTPNPSAKQEEPITMGGAMLLFDIYQFLEVPGIPFPRRERRDFKAKETLLFDTFHLDPNAGGLVDNFKFTRQVIAKNAEALVESLKKTVTVNDVKKAINSDKIEFIYVPIDKKQDIESILRKILSH